MLLDLDFLSAVSITHQESAIDFDASGLFGPGRST